MGAYCVSSRAGGLLSAGNVQGSPEVIFPATYYNFSLIRDCNTNSTPDDQELMGNDCNNDGIIDSCQSPDANANNIPDICENGCGSVHADFNLSLTVTVQDLPHGTPHFHGPM
jgi:hypothetical protein